MGETWERTAGEGAHDPVAATALRSRRPVRRSRGVLGGRLAVARLLAMPESAAAFERRGFAPTSARRQWHLENIGRVFLAGYNRALRCDGDVELAAHLDGFEPVVRGFAYEGAGMGLALLDHMMPWGNRFGSFLGAAGMGNVYTLHVGIGWALARLPTVRLRRSLRRYDPLLRWLAIDGFGFHEGYFHWPRCGAGRRPARIGRDALDVFDQGLGRSLWFVCGGDAARIAAAIASFPEARRQDLWAGVGLACTYAGEATEAELEYLVDAAAAARAHMAQGAAFAAKARQRAGTLTPYTGLATRVICGLDAGTAARVADDALGTPGAGRASDYRDWRARTRRAIATRLGPGCPC